MTSKPQKHKMLKLSLYAKRRQGLSEEDFNDHWSNKHRPLVNEWLAKYGIVRYAQYHTPASLVKSEADASPNFLGMLEPMSYDGIAEFMLPEVKCFERAREDPYYKEHVAPDEDRFFDWSRSTWTIGWEEVYIKDGVIVDMPDGDTKSKGVPDDHHMHHGGGDEGVGAEMLGDRH